MGTQFAYDQIRGALDSGRAVTLSTDPEHNASMISEWLGGSDAPQDGLVDNHVYMVEDIRRNEETGEVTVVLRNPWSHNSAGVGEAAPDGNPYPETSGLIQVSLDDIVSGQGFEYFNVGPAQ